MFSRIELTGFRGFESYRLDDLRRVNLLVGKNNSGKTSVLEAAHLLAAGDLPDALSRHIEARRGLRKEDSWFPKVKAAGGVDRLMRTIETTVMAGTGSSVGFVADADLSATTRWREVVRELKKTGMALPVEVPTEGYIGQCEQSDTRVGVWLMPDNRRRGAIEEFLLELIRPNDPLLEHAARATEQASAIGATFPGTARRKAELRA